MQYLKITTVGEVAFSHGMKLEEGYRYDIPFDETSLPYIPIAELLKKEGLLPEGTELGFAHPKGYVGIVKSAELLLRNRPDSARYIRSYFTHERFLPNAGYRIRSLRAGQEFHAALMLPYDSSPEAREALESISHLGIRTKEITGETKFEVIDEAFERGDEDVLLLPCAYTALEYSVTLFTPTCFHVPYADKLTTKLYMPGAVMKEYLQRHIGLKEDIDWDTLRFGNAYIARDGQRLLPVPASMAVIRLDRQALRYRFASERDPHLVEQVTGLDDAFTGDMDKPLVRHTTPSTEHIRDGHGGLLDALSAGQSFRGFIYGENEDLRRIIKWMGENPIFHVGRRSDAGFGEMLCRVERLLAEEIPAEKLSRKFDVLCVSDVLLLNDRGMNAFAAEDLLRELEYKLGIPGKLKVADRYTNVHLDFSENPRWGTDRPAARMLAKGSTMRVETTDGGAIDISPLRHCFVGERNAEGFGEIYVFQAREQYFRRAVNPAPEKYHFRYPVNLQLIQLGARFIQNVILAMLHSRIKGLGAADRGEYLRGIPEKELMPYELLDFLKENYDPELPDETVRAWYREGLEAGSEESMEEGWEESTDEGDFC